MSPLGMPAATLSCQYVIDRAIQFAPTNSSVMTNPVELLSRIRYMQRRIFVTAAAHAREYLAVSTQIDTSNASSARTIDLTQLTPRLERLLDLHINGVEINLVDSIDPNGELAPRYFAIGQILLEVGSEWGPTTPGTLSATVVYDYAPIDISPTGTTSQPLSIPDPWVDILVGGLAAYAAHKDFGRPASDVAQAQALSDSRLQEFLTFLDNASGTRIRRLDIPRPMGKPE